MLALVPVVGKWLAHAFTARHAWVERRTYALLGVNPDEAMSWQRYGMVLLLSNAGMMLLGYLLLRIQDTLPFDALQRASQSPDLAFNTAASFITNTNWQAYAGESSLSNFADGRHHVPDGGQRGHRRRGRGRLHPRVEPQECGGPRQLLGRFHARDLSRAAAQLRDGARVRVAGHAQTLASDAWATTLEARGSRS